MTNDLYKLKDYPENYYDRLKSFQQMEFLLTNHEILQKDLNFKTPIDYFCHFQKERENNEYKHCDIHDPNPNHGEDRDESYMMINMLDLILEKVF